MGANEYRKIFSDAGLKQEAQTRGRELAAKAYANTATRINSLDGSRGKITIMPVPSAPVALPPKVAPLTG